MTVYYATRLYISTANIMHEYDISQNNQGLNKCTPKQVVDLLHKSGQRIWLVILNMIKTNYDENSIKYVLKLKHW